MQHMATESNSNTYNNHVSQATAHTSSGQNNIMTLKSKLKSIHFGAVQH